MDWLALTHPGKRTAAWMTRHRQWMTEQQSQLMTAMRDEAL
jgi:hypothetical protein